MEYVSQNMREIENLEEVSSHLDQTKEYKRIRWRERKEKENKIKEKKRKEMRKKMKKKKREEDKRGGKEKCAWEG